MSGNREVCSLAARPTIQFALSVVCALVLSFQAVAASSAFEEGNRLYEEGKFQESAAAYRSVLSKEGASAPLYFNLGNACFKSGQVGQAILAYRQAQRLSPRDPDVLANLQFARTQRQGPSTEISTFSRWLAKFSLNEWTIAAAAVLWLWLLLLALLQWRPSLRARLRSAVLGLGGLVVLLVVLLALAWKSDRSSRLGVITVQQASVRHGPLSESQVAFTVNDGAEVRVLDSKDDWYQVSAGSTRMGWIKRDQVAIE
jgi:tetratricopeptide (TPR) repeat protein